MSKRQLLILLGIWVTVFLFLGFSAVWDKLFGLVAGALIVTIAFALKPKEKVPMKGTMPFVDHKTNGDAISGIKATVSADTPITKADSSISA